MRVGDIMTENPAVCLPSTNLQEVAMMMAECDCGAIPVVEDRTQHRPAGIVTDRDIVVRILARGENPLERTARHAMTQTTITVSVDADLAEAAELMKEHQVRRILVVNDGTAPDQQGIVGIVSQADVALAMSDEMTGELVEEVSERR